MLFHYRDRDQLEVDFVLENSAGEIVGIEVKSAASVTRRDFLGLERVASAAGSAFKQGIVLYDGAQTLSDDRLKADSRGIHSALFANAPRIRDHIENSRGSTGHGRVRLSLKNTGRG